MSTKYTAMIDELLGKLERQPLQIENANAPAPVLALEREVRQLLSPNPTAVLEQLQTILEASDGSASSLQLGKAVPLRPRSRQAALRKETVGEPTTSVVPKDGERLHKRLSRNDPCWCGSGRKYKKCHYPN